MQKEHEEAMRRDFAEYDKLLDVIAAADRGPEHDTAIKRRNELDALWESGPHFHYWDHLQATNIAYRESPSDTLWKRDAIRHQYPDYPASVEERNLEQATELAFERHPGLRQISAGYVARDGKVVSDGTKTGREYPESMRPNGVEALKPRPQVSRER